MNIKKRGVNLIILMITIIVMIILAGTVIVSLQNANTIDSSKIAVLKTNISNVLEETNMYIINSYDKVNKKFEYPVKQNLTNEEINKLPQKLKEHLLLDHEVSDVNKIDSTKIFYLDKEKINSSKSLKKEIILNICKDSSVQLYFIDPVIFNNIEYYKLEELSLEEIKKEDI